MVAMSPVRIQRPVLGVMVLVSMLLFGGTAVLGTNELGNVKSQELEYKSWPCDIFSGKGINVTYWSWTKISSVAFWFRQYPFIRLFFSFFQHLSVFFLSDTISSSRVQKSNLLGSLHPNLPSLTNTNLSFAVHIHDLRAAIRIQLAY